jgi:sensor domain CHASE-containing protein
MKIKDGYVLKEIAGNNIVIEVGGKVNFNGMITLNDTGAFLWKKLEEGTEKEALTAALLDEYDVAPEKAAEDVGLFIQKLEGAGILE